MEITAPEFISSWNKLVAKGKVDGIAIPHDGRRLAPTRFGKRAACAYSSPQGFLHFLSGAWKHYGYETEEAFRRDVSRSRVQVKTVTGILSLGSARKLKRTAATVSVFFGDVGFCLKWPCANRAEAADVAEFIERFIPAATPVISEGSWGAIWSGSVFANPKSVPLLEQVRGLPSELRGDFGFFCLLSLGLVAVLAGAFAAGISWVQSAVCILFLFFLITLNRKAHRYHADHPAESPSEHDAVSPDRSPDHGRSVR